MTLFTLIVRYDELKSSTQIIRGTSINDVDYPSYNKIIGSIEYRSFSVNTFITIEESYTFTLLSFRFKLPRFKKEV